jgi:hypothetical protein
MHRVVCCFAGYDALIARQIADALDGRTRGSVPDTWFLSAENTAFYDIG